MRRPRLANKQHEVCAFFMPVCEVRDDAARVVKIDSNNRQCIITALWTGADNYLLTMRVPIANKKLRPTRIREKCMKKIMSMLLCIAALTFAACNGGGGQNNGLGTGGNLSVRVTTGEATEITTNSVTILSYIYGDVYQYGNIEVGIMYSEDEDEVSSHNGRTRKGAFVDDENFSTEISNLSSMTQYYYCAYAKANGNTVYGDVETFSTTGSYAFSVGDGKYVKFSKGNLQYQPSTNKWRFAEHQYDVYGRSAKDNVGSSGWIDLFAWGTGDDPTFAGEYNSFKDAYDYKKSFTDWGTNQIGNDSPYIWRTLTNEEWEYLFSYRLNSKALYGLAKVNNINGLVLLPDNFETPKTLSFNSGREDGYQTNVYTASELKEWRKLVLYFFLQMEILATIGQVQDTE